MKKFKKNIIIFITLNILAHTQSIYADAFQQNALIAAGAALAIGGVHLLVKKVGQPLRKRQPTYIATDNLADLQPLTRRRSFTRSPACNQELSSPDFYQESKKILARTCGVLGVAAGIYLILYGNEILEKITRAQKAYTWLGYWNGFKGYVSSLFAPAESAVGGA
jgi:hypothetical protein